MIELRFPSSDQVTHHIAVNVPNRSAATQIHTTTPIKTFQKNDQAVTSFGALSNKATSGFFISLDF